MNKISAAEGILFVVSAPSGAGKTSLCRELVDSFSDLRQSISFATRKCRHGETDGVDYHFIDSDTFRNMVDQKQFAEWAEVHGNYYGTSLQTLEGAAKGGIDLLLDIDCQGAAQIKKNFQQGVFIFILPPDYEELEKRLRHRGTETDDVIDRRLANARKEIPEARWYDYLVVNDNFQAARDRLIAIVTAERCRSDRNVHLLDKFTLEGDK